MQSWLSGIKFSSNLQSSGHFSKDYFLIYCIEFMYLVTLCNLMTGFACTKSVSESRVHCTAVVFDVNESVLHTAWLWISMTSLLPHTVAQPIKWKFLPKNSSQLVIFVIGLAFTWVWGDKNHQNLIFKVNFLCQKSVCFC